MAEDATDAQEEVPEAQAEPTWATADSIPTDDYEDVLLPRMGRMVRVRYLDTPEIIRLQFLPDYAGYIELVRKLVAGEVDQEEWDAGSASAETVSYQALVTHRSVIDPMHDDEVLCLDCGYRHRRSLWTMNQTRRLPAADLEFVTSVALRAMEVVAAAPFSEAATQSDSDEPASTGESIQPTNSAPTTPAS